MAELSVEEAQRLARQFLTGKAGAADVQRLQEGLADDQTLALELLAQIQTALDDVAPAGLTVDQAKSVDSRVEALVVPRIKSSGAFGWFKKLFKKKVPAEAAEAPAKPSKFKTTSPSSVQAPALVAELPAPSAMESDGLEDMAPISAAPPSAGSGQGADAPVAAAPAADAPASEPKPKPAKAPADPAAARRRKALLLKGLAGLVLLALLAALAWGVVKYLGRPKAEPVPTPVVTPKPAPTAVPTPSSRTPQRGRNLSQPRQEPLPAELRATTPQPAGTLE